MRTESQEMTQPRVLYLIDSLKMGGAERITVTLLPFFKDITPIACTLYDHDSPLKDRLLETGIPLLNVGAGRLADPGAHARFLKLISDEKIDVIHAQLQHATVFASIARRVRNVPVVVTRHVVEDDMTTNKRSRLAKAERIAIRFGVDKLVSVSKAALDAYRPVVGLSEAKCDVIYNGIDLERFQIDDDKSSLRKSLAFPQDKLIVTMVGVMRRGKGQTVAIEAAKKLPDVHFVFVGDGELADDLKAQAADLTNVQFMGTRTDISEILNASDIFILPSDLEALPTVLIEAGAAGLPVVASDVGGVGEIVQDEETGLLIPPRNPSALAEKIAVLAENPERMTQMGQAAFERVNANFTLQKQAESLSALYRSLIR